MREKKHERRNAEGEEEASERRANERDKGIMQRGRTKLVKEGRMREQETKAERRGGGES